MAPAGDSISVDDLLGRITSDAYAIVRTVQILVAPQEIVARHEALDEAFRRSIAQDVSIDSQGPEIARQLAELEAEIEQFYVPFKVRSISRKAWADLLAKHPPTREQVRAESRLTFNPETFPAAAIAATLVSPEMTLDQVKVLENGVDGKGGLTDAQFNTLFNAAVEVNQSGLTAPKSVAASVLHRMSAASSPPPIITESLDPSFSAE